MSKGFVHSIKVPRLYKTAATIVRKVTEDGASLKQLVYEKNHPVSTFKNHVLSNNYLFIITKNNNLNKNSSISNLNLLLMNYPKEKKALV